MLESAEGGRADLLQRLNSEGELEARVVELERSDGSMIWLSVTEVLLLDVDGDIVVDVLVHDVSHIVQSEGSARERIQELERANEDLASFTSVASHELKEPLRTVSRYSEVESTWQ